MKIAIAQISTSHDPAANLAVVEEYAAKAAAQGAELVVFPEATMKGFGTGRLDTCAETLDGPFVQKLQELANAHGLGIVAGIFVLADTQVQDDKEIQRVDNVAVVLLPQDAAAEGAAASAASQSTAGGQPIAYTKIHTFDAFGFQESSTVRPGTELVTFNYRGVTFGLAICYDLRFPELFRQLAKQGAEVILAPASWAAGAGKIEQWQLLTQARALDSGSVLVAADQAEATDERKPGAPTGVGHSAFIDPWGQVISAVGSAPELLLCEVDPALTHDARKQIGVLVHEENYAQVAVRTFS